MKIPVRFRNHADQIAAEAAAYRALSHEQRVLAIFELMATGARMLHESPRRAVSEAVRVEKEQEWRQRVWEFLERQRAGPS